MVKINDDCGRTVSPVGVVLTARIEDGLGRPIVRADVAAIRYSIYAIDELSGLRIARMTDVGLPVSVRDVVFDELVKDPRWAPDDVGYNFRHEVAIGDHVFQFAVDGSIELVYDLIPKKGEKFRLRFQGKVS